MEIVFVFCVLFVIGIFAICLGIYKIFVYENAKKNYSKIVGRVDSYDVETSFYDGVENTTYRPIISYIVNDVKYIINSSKVTMFKSTAQGWIGRSVELYYDPENPKSAIEVENNQGIISIILGIILAGIPAVLFLHMRLFM